MPTDSLGLSLGVCAKSTSAHNKNIYLWLWEVKIISQFKHSPRYVWLDDRNRNFSFEVCVIYFESLYACKMIWNLLVELTEVTAVSKVVKERSKELLPPSSKIQKKKGAVNGSWADDERKKWKGRKGRAGKKKGTARKNGKGRKTKIPDVVIIRA